MKQHALISGAAAAALLLGSSVVYSAALDGPIEIDGPGYVSGNGNAIKTGLGDCLKTGEFSDDNMNNACEGIEGDGEGDGDAMAEGDGEGDDAMAEGDGDADADGADATAEAAPAPEPVEAEPIVTTASLGGEALFDTGSSDLNAAGEQAVAELLVSLEQYQEITDMQVVGHSDDRGPEDFNQALSERRAETVANYIRQAYPGVQMSVTGAGESQPIATNTTPEGRQLNRRVEVQITAKSITQQ